MRAAQPFVVAPSSVSCPICSQSPSKLSFHSVTWLSPPETARIFPVTDQLTRHRTHEKVMTLCVQLPSGVCVQMMTFLSCGIASGEGGRVAG